MVVGGWAGGAAGQVRELLTTFSSRVLDRIANRMGFTVTWARPVDISASLNLWLSARIPL